MRRDKPKRIAWVETGRVPRQLTTLGTSRCKDCRRSSFGCSQLITWALPPSTLQMAPERHLWFRLMFTWIYYTNESRTPFIRSRLMVIFYFFSWLIFFLYQSTAIQCQSCGRKKKKIWKWDGQRWRVKCPEVLPKLAPQTSFLASKNFLRCLICQAPITRRIAVWVRDHHKTRWLVLSLVCRNRSSRTYVIEKEEFWIRSFHTANV